MSEPVISDEEVARFVAVYGTSGGQGHTVVFAALRAAMEDFLKGRVPPAEPLGCGGSGTEQAAGFNACRDIVLRGGK